MMAGGVLAQAAYGAVKDRKARNEAVISDDVKLASKMAIAVTSRRLLVFRAGGAWTLSAEELLTEVPIERVDAIEVGGGMLTKKVTVTVDGQAYPLEAPRFGKPAKLAEALAEAKARTAVAR